MAINKLNPSLVGAILVALGSLSADAQNLRVTEVKRLAHGQTQISGTGSSTNLVTLESTSDFKSWSTVTTFPANTAAMTYTDEAGPTTRIYRLRNGGVIPSPQTLTDLATLPNRVFASPQSVNTIQYAANGNLAYIAWRDRDLIFRERNTSGGWTEATINSQGNLFVPITGFSYTGPRDDFSFQAPAAFVYDSQSRPHVFFAAGTTIVHYVRNNSTWSEAERISDTAASGRIQVLHAAAGASDVIHFLALSADSPRNLTYGSNKSGAWRFDFVSSVNDAPLEYWAPEYSPRWLGFAVDSRNNAHVVYRPEMTTTKHAAGYPRAYSQLWYASNASGAWNKKMIQQPRDASGEAANGASIAIASDDKPRIVSWYNERADTGSSQESSLYFHQPDANNNWSTSFITQTPDRYAADDGNKGAGFAPVLKYDNRGRAHILYLDHAAEHNPFQHEFAGNVRHAWWNGSAWSFETVYRQSTPLQEQAVYPTFAMSGSELAVTFVERRTVWDWGRNPALANSTYAFRFVTKPLQ